MRAKFICMVGIITLISLQLAAANPAAPAITGVAANDPITLSAGTTVAVTCNGTASDLDGWADIDTVNATLWDPAATTEGASDDNNNHYTNTTCALGANTSATDVPVTCTFALWYYSNPAEWACNITLNDTGGEVGTNSTAAITVEQLIALSVSSTLDFTSLAPGATSASDVNHTVTNFGNVQIDLNLSGSDLTNTAASVRNISVGSVKYNVTDSGQDYTANMTALTTSAVSRGEFDLAQRTDDASPSTRDTYWKINVPNDIQALTYNGTVTFTAVGG